MAAKRGLLCLYVSVLSLSSLEALPSTNGANEFYLGFSANGRTSGARASLYIYVTTAERSPVPFYVNTLTQNKTYTAYPDNATVVALDYNDYSSRTERSREFKGIYIKAESNKTISAYAINTREYSAEAYVALPCQQFSVSQYVYYSISTSVRTTTYSSAQGFALIVACEDSTEVSTPTHSVSLDRHQTYLLRDNDDITGIQFKSNKPIVLLSGHECGGTGRLPSCFYNRCCGPLVEQIPPTLSWGTVFLTASTVCNSQYPYNAMHRMVAAHDSTHVQMSCSISQPYSTTLVTRGSKQDVYMESCDTCVIVSDKPILVAEFGQTYMLTIPPIESYLNTYSFYVRSPSTNITIAMLADTGVSPQRTVLYLDDKRLVADWKALSADNRLYGYVTSLTIRSGHHSIVPEDKSVRLHVTVHDDYFGYYGYSAGYAPRPIALVTSQCYVDSCDEESLLCSKNITLFACECPQDFQPITCDDFWNDWNSENQTCNCSSYEQETGCSLTQGMTKCPADVSVCLSGRESCTRFILSNFQCNCSGGGEPINTCDIACPSQYSTATPYVTPGTTQPPYNEDCPENPCLNNGTCTYDGFYYYCHCPSGYSGPRCQYYSSDDYSDDESSDAGAIIAIYVVIFFVIPFCVLPGCGVMCYCAYQYNRHGSRIFKRSSALRAGQRQDTVIQNRGRPPPEFAVPLLQDQLPEEYQWNLAPPSPRQQPRREEQREQESSRGQMVPIERVNELLDPFIQQQDQRWQDEVGVALIPLMSEKPQMMHLCKIVAEDGSEVKIVERVAARFQRVAFALEFQPGVCDAVLNTAHNSYERACQMIFQKWLNGEGRKPVTWVTLIQALEHADFKQLARELKQTLRKDGIHAL